MDAESLPPGAMPGRPAYRPPIGIPEPTAHERGWAGTLLSFALHVLVVLALVAPLFLSETVRDEVLGAGDAGPEGGGGGGNRGRGGRGLWEGSQESLHYVQVKPPAPAAPPTPKAATPAVTPPPPPPPKVEPPRPTPTPPPVPTPPAAAAAPAATPATGPPSTVATGVGAGTGTDGTAGDGPGSGGGVGTGVGTGRGSGTGPGQGGDSAGGAFLPTPTEMILPPFDAPSSVRGVEILVTFDIDETGRIVSVSFPPTRDSGFNKRLRERLQSYRFRPGHSPDGQPVRAKYQQSIFIS